MIVEFYYKNGMTVRKNIRYYTKYNILKPIMFYRDLMDFGNSLGNGKCIYLEWYAATELEKRLAKIELNSIYGIRARGRKYD